MKAFIYALVGVYWLLSASCTAGQEIPVTFTLPEAGYLSLTIDSVGADGRSYRVRNLVQDTYFEAGTHTIGWDGHDEGYGANREGRTYEIEREPVRSGTYHVRGLLHKGIPLRYEFSVQSPGTPPWHTKDGSGAWLSDHAPPADVVFLPAGRYASYPALGVAARLAEAGHGVMFLREDGRKVQGFSHIRNSLRFLEVLTRDEGPEADPAYLSWGALVRGGIKLVYAQPAGPNAGNMKKNQFSTNVNADALSGMAAYNNVVAVSYRNGADEGILFVDATRAKEGDYTILNDARLNDVRGIATDGSFLYALVGTELRKYRVDWAAGSLGDASVLASGLEDPRQVKLLETSPGTKELYVSDHGESHQIKVYDQSGSLRRTIGTKGGPQVGAYDETRMSHPDGMAVDSQGKLWVAEEAYMPKRLSVWDARSGAFLQAYYGPPKYGGGLVIDSLDSRRAYYAGSGTGVMEFDLDWANGTARPARILHNRERAGEALTPPRTRKGTDAPMRMHVIDGERYFFTHAWSQSHAAIYGEIGIWHLRGDTLAWVGQVGRLSSWERVFYDREAYPAIASYVQGAMRDLNPGRVVFIWSDVNNNGDVSLDELQFFQLGKKRELKFYLDDRLNIHVSDGYLLPLDQITEAGVPVYDMARYHRAQAVETGPEGQITYGDGTLITTHGPIDGYRDGRRVWRYHSQWPRRARGAPVSRFRGDLVRTTRIIGPPHTVPTGEAGAVWALNSEHGEIYLFTTDGFFITTLLADNRTEPLWRYEEGEIQRGDPIGAVSPSDEHFWPFLSKGDDGELYLTAGKEHTSILRLDGLDTIRRLDLGTVRVGDVAVAQRSAARPDEVAQQARKNWNVPVVSSAPSVDGRLEEWDEADWVALNSELKVRAALAIHSDSLYVALQTARPDLLNNAGDDYRYDFATGGGIDLLVGQAGADPTRKEPVEGDKRLFVTRTGADPTTGPFRAVLYEQVKPNRPDTHREVYDSPVGTTTLDFVADVTPQITVAANEGDFEVAVPLSLLELEPQEGRSLLGDVGILLGDGVETQRRVYWNNTLNTIVSDIPSEARLAPEHWGIWTFTNGRPAN